MRRCIAITLLAVISLGTITYLKIRSIDAKLSVLVLNDKTNVADCQYSDNMSNNVSPEQIALPPDTHASGLAIQNKEISPPPAQQPANRIITAESASHIAPTQEQQQVYTTLDARMFEYGMKLDTLLSTPEAASLPPELRDKLVVKAVERINSGELKPEEFLPNFHRPTRPFTGRRPNE